MQRQLSFRDSEEGVSPIIGTVLILGIMVTITGTMLAWGIPQIQESEAYAIYREGYGGSNWLSQMFNKYRIQLAFLKDNEVVNSFQI